jgi:hypothetical protein
MKGRTVRLALAATFVMACAAPAFAADQVKVEQPWMRFIIKATPAAGYMTLRNESDKAVTLTGASSPACGMLMLHQSKQEKGIEKMQHVAGLPVPPHGTANLAPGGYHLMCMQPKAEMKVGATVPVTLKFKDGQTLTAQFPVKGPGGK